MNPLSTTKKKSTPAGAVCPHCNTPIKFSVVGLLRNTYTCPTCQSVSTHRLGLPGPALISAIVLLPLILACTIGFGARLAMPVFGICPLCLDLPTRLLIMTPLYTLGMLLNIAVVATLAQSHRTLSQPS